MSSLVEKAVVFWIKPLVTAVLMLAFSFWVLVGIGWGVVESRIAGHAPEHMHHLVASDSLSVEIRGRVDVSKTKRNGGDPVYLDGFVIDFEKRDEENVSLALQFGIEKLIKPARCRFVDASGKEVYAFEVDTADRTLEVRVPLDGHHGSLRFVFDEPSLQLRFRDYELTAGKARHQIAMGPKLQRKESK